MTSPSASPAKQCERCPPWARVLVIDRPGQEAAPGNAAYSCFDLANFGVVFVCNGKTRDRARGGRFEILGRVLAEVRGCS